MQQTNQEIIIRPARIADLRDIMSIQNYYIENSFALWRTTPYSMEEMLKWWSEHNRSTHPIYVAVLKAPGREHVVGFAALSAFRMNDGYRFCAENSLYVLPLYIGKGLGKALMNQLLTTAKAAGVRIVTAWIDSENENSIDFHKSLGFVPIGTMPEVGETKGSVRSVSILDLNLLSFKAGEEDAKVSEESAQS